jgi:hypothetical protein
LNNEENLDFLKTFETKYRPRSFIVLRDAMCVLRNKIGEIKKHKNNAKSKAKLGEKRKKENQNTVVI